jgi:hypothetical protein
MVADSEDHLHRTDIGPNTRGLRVGWVKENDLPDLADDGVVQPAELSRDDLLAESSG